MRIRIVLNCLLVTIGTFLAAGCDIGGAGPCDSDSQCPEGLVCAPKGCVTPELPEDPICESKAYSLCEENLAIWYDSCDRRQGVRENCAPNLCEDGKCLEPTCDDGIRNGGETDVDCAGDCPLCEDGKACLVHSDCVSQSCLQGICTAATCEDQLLNGGESDIDCGGDCTGCANGKRCESGNDCESNTCDSGLCVAAFCADSQLNGFETDIDCGGPDCTPCSGGQDCTVATDCLSLSCVNETCEFFNCPSGMSQIGTSGVCVDHYEASVFETSSCTGTQYGIDSDGSPMDNYPQGFPDKVASQQCEGLCEGMMVVEPSVQVYACNLENVFPSAHLTWFQAKRACENSGKHLCRLPGEWRLACAGEPSGTFPYGDSYVEGLCNGGEAGVAAAVTTGSRVDCHGRGFSSAVFDMSGNVWEWTQTCTNGCLQAGGAFADLGNYLSCQGGTLEAEPSYSGPSAGFRCCWSPGN